MTYLLNAGSKDRRVSIVLGILAMGPTGVTRRRRGDTLRGEGDNKIKTGFFLAEFRNNSGQTRSDSLKKVITLQTAMTKKVVSFFSKKGYTVSCRHG